MYFDGDVVIYVLCDVILGVFVMGDIGKYFFDIVSEYENIDSWILLCYVVGFVKE